MGAFSAPVIDFFPPRDDSIADFVGIIDDQNGSFYVFRFKPSVAPPKAPKRAYRSPLDPGEILRTYQNDLGGRSIAFTEKITYLGCSEKGVQVAVAGSGNVRSYHYDAVARIRTPDGEIIWENLKTAS